MAENLTTYTEVDPNTHMTVTSTAATVINSDRNEDMYLYDDKGINHFSGDYEHLLDLKVTANDDGSAYYPYNLANLIDDGKGIIDASGDFIGIIQSFPTSSMKLFIRECDGGTIYEDSYENSTFIDVIFYLKIKRDEAVGTYGTIYCYIYSNPGRTTLLDTVSVALHTSKKDFRYAYLQQTNNTGSALKWSSVASNFDLQEAVARAGMVMSGRTIKGLIRGGLLS